MKILDFTKTAQKYKGMWVALADSKSIKVVGHGKTLKTALMRATKNGYDHPVVSRMPEDINAVCVGGFQVM